MGTASVGVSRVRTSSRASRLPRRSARVSSVARSPLKRQPGACTWSMDHVSQSHDCARCSGVVQTRDVVIKSAIDVHKLGNHKYQTSIFCCAFDSSVSSFHTTIYKTSSENSRCFALEGPLPECNPAECAFIVP